MPDDLPTYAVRDPATGKIFLVFRGPMLPKLSDCMARNGYTTTIK